METRKLLALCLCLVGCVHFRDEPRTSRAEEDQARRDAKDRREAEERAEHSRVQSERELARRAEQLAVAQSAAREKEDKAQQLASSCQTSREDRLKVFANYLEKRQRIRELEDWEEDHCKWVDASKAVTRRVQDGNGRYHFVEGRDRGVDRVCDAKLPPELSSTYARNMFVSRPSYQPEWVKCQELDIAASPVAAEFWK